MTAIFTSGVIGFIITASTTWTEVGTSFMFFLIQFKSLFKIYYTEGIVFTPWNCKIQVSHIDTNAKQTHWNNRNGPGSPKGDWGQAQPAFTTSWFMFECYFFTSRIHCLLFTLPPLPPKVVPAKRGGEWWMQKVHFPHLSICVSRHIHDLSEVLPVQGGGSLTRGFTNISSALGSC